MNLDALQFEISTVRNDMKSISPKTSTYKKLEKQLDVLLNRWKEARKQGATFTVQRPYETRS